MGRNGVDEVSTLVTDRFQKPLREPEGSAHDQTATEDLEVAFSCVGREANVASHVMFRVVLEGWPRVVHPMIRDEVYRIGREALLNAFRHSEASCVEINLEYAAKQLRISVYDNGKGISAELFRSGCNHRGFSGMQQLAERIGAKLTLFSRVALGTAVVLSIPGQVAYESQPGVRSRGWGYFSRWSA